MNNLQEYIFLETKDQPVLIEKTISHKGINFYQAQEILQAEQATLPTIPVYLAFIDCLLSKKVYDGNKKELGRLEITDLLEQVLGLREQYEEWLDAEFRGCTTYVYHRFNEEGDVEEVRRRVANHLKEKCLVDFIKRENGKVGLARETYNKQGLPKKLSEREDSEGKLIFIPPINKNLNSRKRVVSAVTFRNLPKNPILYCNRNPLLRTGTTGVRAVRYGTKV